MATACVSIGAQMCKQNYAQDFKTKEQCNRAGIAFIPIAVESLGAWHKSAIGEVKKLGSAKARQNGEEESVEISRLFQKLSVALMRGNCALFNNRVPSSDAGLMLE